MSRYKCPYCGKGEMVLEVIPKHLTKMGGVPVEIPDARIAKCTKCGETSVSATELKRWEEVLKQQLRSAGHVPSPSEVTEVRKAFGLSVSDFAKLLGVTRQTIHAWERTDLDALQLGPASLLLGLLREEIAGKSEGVFRYLLDKARARGQEIQASDVPDADDHPRWCRASEPGRGPMRTVLRRIKAIQDKVGNLHKSADSIGADADELRREIHETM